MQKILYHGSRQQDLKELKPNKGESQSIFATSCEAFAAIFINRPGGSLVASWGRLKNKTPYYCELKKGIFKKNYSRQQGSIYIIDSKYFFQNKKHWKEEWVSTKTIPILREIKVNDLKAYLLKLQREKKVKIILFRDRNKFFPNIDNQIIKTAKALIKKYGQEKILPNIRKYRSEILDKI